MNQTPSSSSSQTAMPWEAPVVSTTEARVDVLALDVPELTAFVVELGEKAFRGKQIFAWLHERRARSFDEMTDVSKALRARLVERAAIRMPVVDEVKVSSDGTRKYRLTTWDGHSIESVWIPHASGSGKHALCISSQVGCAMGCTFCATAAMKLTRHLSAGEIVGQVYAVLRDLDENLPQDPPRPESMWRLEEQAVEGDSDDMRASPGDDDDDSPRGRSRRRIQNIVYMGMGEPLHNVDNVIASIHLLTHPQGLFFSPRRITVSTSGLVHQLRRLGDETGVHLAISLNGSHDEQRTAVMPVNKRFDLTTLIDACRAFPLDRRRRITFEYVMLAGVNDSDDDAHRVTELLRGLPTKVNLIPFNAHPLSPYARPDDLRVEKFRTILEKGRLPTFVRTTRGLDIDAACGMLGARKLEAARLQQADASSSTGKGSLPVVG